MHLCDFSLGNVSVYDPTQSKESDYQRQSGPHINNSYICDTVCVKFWLLFQNFI